MCAVVSHLRRSKSPHPSFPSAYALGWLSVASRKTIGTLKTRLRHFGIWKESKFPAGEKAAEGTKRFRFECHREAGECVNTCDI